MKLYLVLAGPTSAPAQEVDFPTIPRIGEALAAHDGGETKMLVVTGIMHHLTDRVSGSPRTLERTDVIVAHLPKPGDKQIILPR